MTEQPEPCRHGRKFCLECHDRRAEDLTVTVTRWQEALQLLRDVVMHGEDAIDQRNGETVKAKCKRFLDEHGGWT